MILPVEIALLLSTVSMAGVKYLEKKSIAALAGMCLH